MIEDDLNTGDHVVVEGFQKFTPGALVLASSWGPPDTDYAPVARPAKPASAQSQAQQTR